MFNNFEDRNYYTKLMLKHYVTKDNINNFLVSIGLIFGIGYVLFSLTGCSNKPVINKPPHSKWVLK